MHVKTPFYFHADRVSQYSEQDYIVKFWAPLFKTFLSADEHIFLHWGDTQSSSLKDQGIQARLDMRILLIKHGVLYQDRLDPALAAKAYINSILSKHPHLDKDGIQTIKIPYIQIMGFKADLSVMSVVDKGVCAAEDVAFFSFPTTMKQMRVGAMQDIVKALSMIKIWAYATSKNHWITMAFKGVFIKYIKNTIEEGKLNHDQNKIMNIVHERKPPRKSISEYIDKVISANDIDEATDEESDDKDDDGDIEALFNQ